MGNAVFHWNNRSLHYRETGKGALVMLIHGFGMDGQVWDGITPALSEKFHCIIPDIPGSGLSDPPEHWSIDHFAEAIIALAAHLGHKKKFAVVGHSMGGYIGLAMADNYPDQIKALTLFHSTTYADDDVKIAARKKSIQFIQQHGAGPFIKQFIPNLFAESNRQKNNKEITALIARHTNFSAEALVGYYEAMIARKDRTHVLKNSRIWFQFIIGAGDPAVSPAHALEQSALPEKSSIHYLDNLGHMGMIEDPAEIIRILVKFLQTIEIENQ